MAKPVIEPGPDHPITIEKNDVHVQVCTPSGHVVADTTNALTLTEATIPPVLYIPLADLDDSVLERTKTTSYCPYKGEANYFSIKDGDQTLTDTIWFYEHPHDAVSEITDHAAFYTDRVQVSTG